MYNNLPILSSTLFSPAIYWRGCIQHQLSNSLMNQLNNLIVPLHLSRDLYKSNLFLQNEPNSPGVHDDISSYFTRRYKNYVLKSTPKNEPKRTQNEPNFSSKMALFPPKLALFYNEIFAFANKFNLSAGLQSKNAEHSCGLRLCRLIINFYSLTYRYKQCNCLCGRIEIFVESSLSLEGFYENTKVSEINPCQSVKSVVDFLYEHRVSSIEHPYRLYSLIFRYSVLSPMPWILAAFLRLLFVRLRVSITTCSLSFEISSNDRSSNLMADRSPVLVVSKITLLRFQDLLTKRLSQADKFYRFTLTELLRCRFDKGQPLQY